MTSAFKCDRCGKFITNMGERSHYKQDNTLPTLLFGIDDRASIDLCMKCQIALQGDLKIWWHGLAPK